MALTPSAHPGDAPGISRTLRAALFAVAVLTASAVPHSSSAQGFNTFSGRNHPELRWQVAETDHFKIMYPAHLAGVEQRIAAIAEASWSALSANLRVAPEKPMRIYVTDEDQVANGFAMPLGAGHTNIWLHPGPAGDGWTGSDKWLRRVLAHEIAHLFHYQAVRSPVTPLDRLFGDPLPRFWTEGLAQYETETWDAYRGAQWLRAAVLEDALSYRDGRSLRNGRLLYAVGNAQVRFFATAHGDSALASLLAHRTRVLPGVRVHRFYRAFEQTAGESYRDFYERWRRHVNVQYNSLAGTVQWPDSLGEKEEHVPGRYVSGIRHGPPGARAAITTGSVSRPVTGLYVQTDSATTWRRLAEGALVGRPAWRPDGTSLVYTARVRGAGGSLVYELYEVATKGGRPRRLTEGRGAGLPAFSRDGRLAYVAYDGPTAQVMLAGDTPDTDEPRTGYAGDVQIVGLAWHPSGEWLAAAVFHADGRRSIERVEAAGDVTTQTVWEDEHDQRDPVFSPGGDRLAVTSLRDGVPNVFLLTLPRWVVSPDSVNALTRVTSVVTGAAIHDWHPADDDHPAGRLMVVAPDGKTGDAVYLVDARMRAAAPPPPPAAYARWTTQAPPNRVPSSPVPNPALINSRSRYRSLANLTHVLSLGGPYVDALGDWGFGGFTLWTEPLGKHSVFVTAGISAPSPTTESFVSALYINNQLRPSLQFSGFAIPASVRPYANEVLEERVYGGTVSIVQPIDRWQRPYTRTRAIVRLRGLRVEPRNLDVFADNDIDAPLPEEGTQLDARLGLARTRVRPYRHNLVHPLDGRGARIRIMGAYRPEAPAGNEAFFRAEAAAYETLPALGRHRLYVYGRARIQQGASLAQDFIGLSRRDELRVVTPDLVLIQFREIDRVRGYKQFAVGRRVLFGSAEYRVPLPDLRTNILGVVRFGAASIAAFADAAAVFNGTDIKNGVRRVGVGVELKNELILGGALRLMHALGAAAPASDLNALEENGEVYYRIGTALAF